MQPTPSLQDPDLVRACLEGDRDAFGSLVVRYSRVVRAICTARIGARDVDDAVQDVFLRAFRGLERLQDPGNFGSYVGQIARNLCIDRLRTAGGRRTQMSLDEVDMEPADNRLESDDAKDLMLERLRREVGKLPENQREVLLLFYFERMSYAAMSRVLGVTEAAVNQRLSRARQRLRTTFAKIPEAHR